MDNQIGRALIQTLERPRDGLVVEVQPCARVTLKLLMRDSLVLRSVETSVPPKVSYELTAMGHGLAARLSGVSSWIGDHIPDLERARSRFDQSSA